MSPHVVLDPTDLFDFDTAVQNQVDFRDFGFLATRNAYWEDCSSGSLLESEEPCLHLLALPAPPCWLLCRYLPCVHAFASRSEAEAYLRATERRWPPAL